MSELGETIPTTKTERSLTKQIKDSEEMIDVKMNTFGVTSARRPNPILKTIGFGDCVAVALYEPKTKVAGLVHIAAPQIRPRWKGPSQDIANTLMIMQKNGVPTGARGRIEAHMVGGWPEDDLHTIVRERLDQLGIKKVKTDVRSDELVIDTMAIDARGGQVFRVTDILQKSMDLLDEITAMTSTPLGAEPTSDPRTLK